MVLPVGDIDASGTIDGDPVGLVEAGPRGRSAISGIAGLAAAGAGRDHTRARLDAPNAMVEGIAKIQVATCVEPDVEWTVKQGARCWPAIAAITLLAGSHRRRNNPGLLWHRLETPAAYDHLSTAEGVLKPQENGISAMLFSGRRPAR